MRKNKTRINKLNELTVSTLKSAHKTGSGQVPFSVSPDHPPKKDT